MSSYGNGWQESLLQNGFTSVEFRWHPITWCPKKSKFRGKKKPFKNRDMTNKGNSKKIKPEKESIRIISNSLRYCEMGTRQHSHLLCSLLQGSCKQWQCHDHTLEGPCPYWVTSTNPIKPCNPNKSRNQVLNTKLTKQNLPSRRFTTTTATSFPQCLWWSYLMAQKAWTMGSAQAALCASMDQYQLCALP